MIAAHELHAKKSEELKAAKAKRAEILITDARERVARNPTDLQLRFELGEHLVSARRFREAVAGVAAGAAKSTRTFESDELARLLLQRAWDA